MSDSDRLRPATDSARPAAAHRPSAGTRSFAETLERTLAKLPVSQSLAAGGTLASLLGLVPACEPASPADLASEAPTPAALRQEVIAFGQHDWAQNLGTHNPSMVTYYNEYWRDLSNCNSRFGCMSITVFIKVKVRPVLGADLGYKKVGAVYREVGQPDPITTTGFYFATLPDGMEEWHVPIKSTSHAGTFTFNVWYEDGKSGRYYDDNNGELWALRWVEDALDYTTLSQDFAGSTAVFDATGVKGPLSFTVEDLDYDKELRFLYSTDNWVTTHTVGIGAATDSNSLHWVSNVSRDFERWQISLDLPGAFTSFRYKLVYRHGVVNGAQPIEFTLGGSAGYALTRKP
jgi:hypothetical protein